MKNNSYSLNKDVLTIKTTFGHYKFKIEDTDLLDNAERIVKMMIGEIEKVDKKLSSRRERSGQYARLLLTNLNLCEKYVQLEDKYSNLTEKLELINRKLEAATASSQAPIEDEQKTPLIPEEPIKIYPASSSAAAAPSAAEPLSIHVTAEPAPVSAAEQTPETTEPVVSAPPLTMVRESLPAVLPAESVSLIIEDPDPVPVVVPSEPEPTESSILQNISIDKNSSINSWKLKHSYLALKRKAVDKMIQVRGQSQADINKQTVEADTLHTTEEKVTAAEIPVVPLTEEITSAAVQSTPATSPQSTPLMSIMTPTTLVLDNRTLLSENTQVISIPVPPVSPSIQENSSLPSMAFISPSKSPETIVMTEMPFVQVTPEQCRPALKDESQNFIEKDQVEDIVLTSGTNPTMSEQSALEQYQSPAINQIDETDQAQVIHQTPATPHQAPEIFKTEEITNTQDIPQNPTISTHNEPTYIINRPEQNNQSVLKPKVYRKGEFQLPNFSFLRNTSKKTEVDHHSIRRDAELLEKKLGYFGIKGEVMGVSPGPVITTFEYRPEPGIKISKIVNLADDLALALSAFSIRIVAPIPGKDVMGIEIPNIKKSLVPFIDIVSSNEFINSKSKVPICLGKDIIGNPVVVELDKMPHLLIAGATGTGKSVGLNAMITSILYKSTPEEVKFLMVDPKRIELSFYNDIPHLLTPVITDMKKATIALQWMVREMDRRYSLLAKSQVRHIEQYNQKIKSGALDTQEGHEASEPLPFIVVIIDELADLMMTASRDIEFSLTRLAQMARAAGIHLILATQRPSVDVLTGIIKANFPTRISFQVSSKTDSRTIIDSNGAETLLGNGDMLFVPPGTARLTRVHGTYLSEEELTDITSFLKAQGKPEYVLDVITETDEEPSQDNSMDDDYDDKYNEALDFVVATRQASISGIQRALRVGYNRAARIIDIMEKRGIVGPSDGVKPRRVIVENIEY